eukprot:TRINITY_DN2227_c2_g1_i1.p2 TRINITY_DN2227_c2_g1~~TRINITY_DN2227_c2_g1_i1.p2  ORF type:complete len:286 (-),score=66.77 TRINITY_DN2227_c2_g1_i1:271-1128(-)
MSLSSGAQLSSSSTGFTPVQPGTTPVTALPSGGAASSNPAASPSGLSSSSPSLAFRSPMHAAHMSRFSSLQSSLSQLSKSAASSTASAHMPAVGEKRHVDMDNYTILPKRQRVGNEGEMAAHGVPSRPPDPYQPRTPDEAKVLYEQVRGFVEAPQCDRPFHSYADAISRLEPFQVYDRARPPQARVRSKDEMTRLGNEAAAKVAAIERRLGAMLRKQQIPVPLEETLLTNRLSVSDDKNHFLAMKEELVALQKKCKQVDQEGSGLRGPKSALMKNERGVFSKWYR